MLSGVLNCFSAREVEKSSYESSWNPLDCSKHDLSVHQGKILNVGGTGPKNYTFIQEAVDSAENGDMVFVWHNSSPYYENIRVDKQIILQGEDKNSTVIDGNGLNDVVDVQTKGAYISGFTIRNSGNNWIDSGIKLNADEIVISGNIITSNFCGIYSQDLEDSVIVENDIIDNMDSGVFLPFSSNITIIRNNIINNRENGIYLYDSNVDSETRNEIMDNYIRRNRCGVFLWFSYRTDIHKNFISDNDIGVSLNHHSRDNTIKYNTITDIILDGVFLNYSNNNVISENIISTCRYGISIHYCSYVDVKSGNYICYNDYGVVLFYSTYNLVSSNRISANRYGVYLDRADLNQIEWNNIIDSDEYGMFLFDNSKSNAVESNNFIDNTDHAFHQNSFGTRWSRNYWSKWSGSSFYIIFGRILILDGLIDINWFNLDLYPSKNPNVFNTRLNHF
jgi:nitrous oxidase accessory protein